MPVSIDFQQHVVAAPAQAHRHLAAGAVVLDGVFEQVPEQPFQGVGVGRKRGQRSRIAQIGVERHAALGGGRAQVLDRMLHQLVEPDRGARHRLADALQARQRQQVVEQRLQATALARGFAR